MGPNPFLGVIYHWIGGFASATNFIPFRGIKRWSWEIYWIIQGVAAWLIAPTLLASIFVPHVFGILHQAPSSAIGYAIFWGMLWGTGGLTFGLAIRYLGLGLGYAIALGLCTAFGTLMPPIFSRENGHMQLVIIAHQASGRVILIGVLVCLIAVAINGLAGMSKEKEITEEEKASSGERDFSFATGMAVAIFAGIMSSCFAYGLAAGKPIGEIAKVQLLASGHSDLWQNLPVLIVVLWGGFITNFVWSLILILKNRSFAQFGGQPGSNPLGTSAETGTTLQDVDPRTLTKHIAAGPLTRNYILAALAGVIWYFQFFFYSMGQTKMGKYDFSSWALHMASIIIFATLWGLILGEWRGTGTRTRTLVASGLGLLIASTLIIGYGNYLKTEELVPARVAMSR
ncbi:L-rhamnose-H+ transport protein [Silvibacterium bohemicum]|uniref:L-rhamnose-H+ transport protein n=1 Tax=Silvibacterium bohemicum TaxID=1577686 RepID=A0A841JW22_9BACT|nr:L-rhamnose/proton symporter RhaT [Silvibacterium bohemicum]MBB6145350.1 L-rhamnose-H+ transport protein [Silvibacterium bohemicum]